MTETKSDGFITWNRGLLHERTTHVNLRSDSARRWRSGFSLGRHFDREITVEDGKNEKKLRAFLNPKRLGEEEESNDDSWKTVVFYRQKNPQRYAALGSRPNPRLTRGVHIKCNVKFTRQRKDVSSTPPDMWQRAQNTDSCLTENRVPSKVAPLQQGQSRA